MSMSTSPPLAAERSSWGISLDLAKKDAMNIKKERKREKTNPLLTDSINFLSSSDSPVLSGPSSTEKPSFQNVSVL